ncbi:AraC family transcriptional regulator [Flavobacterium sp. CSZ]|uniref:helix-turn-helix domain-containing protein n=1 Tax=Flavobacterium sp. CSZ TaxID=2783791 RepID=UPI00188BA12E|nr:AraC family transcriptional regulator [Flavobacterium sp. CSZ]MBF4484835.1 helix-turn-helix transcriptional regulator [Flavobacterium sp. CSZ]
MKKKSNIELHTKELDSLGLQVRKIVANNVDFTGHLTKAHRDDHYVFYIQEEGLIELMIDFKNHQIKDQALFFIAPGQVHYYTKQVDSKGHFIFLNPSYLQNTYRRIFDTHQNISQVVSIENFVLFKTTELIFHQVAEAVGDIQKNIIRSLADSLMGMVVLEFSKNENYLKNGIDRKTELTFQFRQLVQKHFLELKRPKDYAALLHISVPYLNEMVKEQTGCASSYWIQHEILLEAKRLLFYTQLNTKEIAFSLQYEDHTYFSRFFKKNEGITPLEFRKNYCDLSNQNS